MARLRCSDVFGSLAWPHLPNGHQAVPVREELLDISQGEITDGGSGKIFDQPGDAAAQVKVAHFVHAVEEEDDAPCVQISIKEIIRYGDTLALQIGAHEGEEPLVAFCAILGRVVRLKICSQVTQGQENGDKAALWYAKPLLHHGRAFGTVTR